jgi:biopolymer transport protein ExbD
MSRRFKCKLCGKTLVAPPKLVGKKLKCPYCRAEVTVPAADAASTFEPPTAAKTSTAGADDEPPTDSPLLLFPPKEKHGDLIDMTAMVDIVFFLLIFFMVTSMAPLEAVINLPTPESTAASSNVQAVPDIVDDPGYVVVTIDADDAVFVDDDPDEVLSEQDLRAKLRAALRQDDREGMLIKCAGDATHGKFVMVLDAGADAGVKELLFSVDQTAVEADGG